MRPSHGHTFGSGALQSSRYFGGAQLSKQSPLGWERGNIIHNYFLSHFSPREIMKFWQEVECQDWIKKEGEPMVYDEVASFPVHEIFTCVRNDLPQRSMVILSHP